jgi:murein DD-endopeptidase MepM/ murein hydrolase activator NlpD
MTPKPRDLPGVLDASEAAESARHVQVGAGMEAIGRRAWAAAVVALTLACARGTPLGDLLHSDASPHERYAASLRDAGLDSTAMGREWLAAGDSALRHALLVDIPHREVGIYRRSEARAVAHRVVLRAGQRLEVTLRAEGLPARLFLDLFRATDDAEAPFERLGSADTVAGSGGMELALVHESRRGDTVLVRLQPELLRDGRYELVMRLEPVLAFPVADHGNRAIRSYFGAERDGGARVHHGIDIFAPRGTPVLAAARGVIRSTRPNDLGGNVVWLRDDARGQSLYYAHLEAHAVEEGDVVLPGDTLGFVGNTGNARTTPPHLHFGIYRRPEGPIDPLDWVRLLDSTPATLRADTTGLGRGAVLRRRPAAVRVGPAGDEVPLDTLRASDTVVVMGATGGWYRVQFSSGRSGYLAAEAVRTLAGEGDR